MAALKSTHAGDIFASVALCIVVITELICMLGYPILARLVRQKATLHKLYPQDAYKVCAVASTVLGFAMTVVYLPTCMALLGWHRSLDHHPLACLVLPLVISMLSFISMINMFLTGLMFGVSIVFPLHFERIFTHRRTVLLILLFVWVTPILLITPFGLIMYNNNGYFSLTKIHCLAGLHYWPAWMKQVSVFGLIIPIMTQTFIIHFYVMFVAWKQSKRQVVPEQRPAPAVPTPMGKNHSVETPHGDSVSQPKRTKQPSTCWKGTWMIILLVSSVIFFLLPVYGTMILLAVCESCIPQDVGYILLLLVFALTPLGTIGYNLMHQRSRAAVKDILVSIGKCRHRHQDRDT